MTRYRALKHTFTIEENKLLRTPGLIDRSTNRELTKGMRPGDPTAESLEDATTSGSFHAFLASTKLKATFCPRPHTTSLSRYNADMEAAADSLESLELLQRDLIASLEGRLENVDRLAAELEAHIVDFKRLLDRDRRNEKSRNSLIQGTNEASTLEIEGTEYTITTDFKDAALIVADELDLDEVEAAKLCLHILEQMDQVDDALPYRAVLRFQIYRLTLLDCLRLVLKRSADTSDDGDEISEMMQTLVRLVVRGNESEAPQQSAFWRKCIDSLAEVEEFMSRTQSYIETMIMTGQDSHTARADALQFQRNTLAHQHEALAAVMCYLVRSQYVLPEDFRAFLSKAANSDLGADLLSQFAPVLIAGSSYFGADAAISQTNAQELHRLFADSPAKLTWKNAPLGAAATVWWVAEYSGRMEGEPGREDLDKLFFRAIEQNAFQYMLSLGDFYKPEQWHDPAKAGLVTYLLDTTNRFQQGAIAPLQEFAQLTMQEYQVFIEAMVSHMHGALRELKIEEDTQRRNLGIEDQSYEMHLERFLLIIAYAYQDDVIAAMDFWGDTESGLYGFLRWTARRLPTPRVAAFCEMLRSLANGDKAATAAHRFLLEDAAVPSSRNRRAYSLSWQQMFSELELFSSTIRNRPAPSLPDATHDPDVMETETPIMLEAYLRLIAHIMRNSVQARDWVLREQTFKLHECLLQLAQSAIVPAVQASCFDVLTTMVRENTTDIRDGVWFAIDQWLSGGDEAAKKGPHKDHGQLYLQRIASDAEVATAFVNLLTALITSDDRVLDALPYPEQLGTSRRRNGIDHYVDFVLSMALPLTAPEQSVTTDRMQIYVLRHACFLFIQSCLSSFNEDLAVLENTPKPFSAYVQAHPFARVMEHLLNDQVIAILFQTVQQYPDELRTFSAPSPLIQAVALALSVINLVLDRQATYFDIVRPLIKTKASRREPTVSNPAYASFDDVLLAHLDIVNYLSGYLSSSHDVICFLSIDLLKKMSASRKISTHTEPGAPRQLGSRLLNRLSDSGEALQTELRQMFVPQELELEGGQPQLTKAQAIIDLINTSLAANPAVPNLAHCLLGFECGPTEITITDESLFSRGKALFHSIATLAILLPQVDMGGHSAPLESTRASCLETLERLMTSSLSNAIVVTELEGMDFLPALEASLEPVNETATWDGYQAQDPTIWLSDGAQAVESFMKQRGFLFSLVSSIPEHSLSPAFILALLDFFDIEIAQPVEVTPKLIKDFDATLYVATRTSQATLIELKQVVQALALAKRQLIKSGGITEQSQDQQVDDEITAIITSVRSFNNHTSIVTSRLETLETWADVVCGLASSTGETSTLQSIIQHTMPRFDRALDTEIEAVSQFAKVILMVARSVRDRDTQSQSPSGMLLKDALLHAYRSSLKAVQDGESDPSLRDVSYRICSIILQLLSSKAESMQINERTVLIVAEDAFASRGVTRISALLFLDATLRANAKVTGLLRTLQKINFLPVLIDASISNMAVVFRDESTDQTTSLAYFHAAATVLLRIAQISGGAQLILDSGFILAVQDSGLFSTDPDVGLDIDNPAALQHFYKLLAAILRILVAIVVGRGPGDGSTMQIVRKFLSDNRMSMSAVFKLLSRQEKVEPGMQADAREIADELGRLIHITSFLDVSGFCAESTESC